MSSYSIAIVVTNAVLVISGLISNGFIVAMMIIQWTKCRRFSSGEQLLLSLGLSNWYATIVLAVFNFSVFFQFRFNYLSFQICYSFVTFSVILRFWLTALLCFFYCIKIVNSTHAFFLWCKSRLSWLIPRLLVASLFFSLFVFLVTNSTMHIPPQKNTTANVTTATQIQKLRDNLTPFKMLFASLGSGCPLIVVLLCSILVVASLCGHVCQMTGKEAHLRSFQTNAHIKAGGTVLSLLFLYVLFYAAQTKSLDNGLSQSDGFFVSTVMTMYSPAQAAILLLINTKIKQALSHMLRRTKP